MISEIDQRKLRSLSRATRGGTLETQRLAEVAYRMGSASCHQAIVQSFTLPELPPPETLNLAELEKAAIKTAIQTTHGNLFAAAKLLGIGKTTVYRKAKLYAIRRQATFCPSCGRLISPPSQPIPIDRQPAA